MGGYSWRPVVLDAITRATEMKEDEMLEPFAVKSSHVFNDNEFSLDVSVGLGSRRIGIEISPGIVRIMLVWWHVGLAW